MFNLSDYAYFCKIYLTKGEEKAELVVIEPQDLERTLWICLRSGYLTTIEINPELNKEEILKEIIV